MSSHRNAFPSLTVIIAAYNHFEWLRLVLEGLRHQTVAPSQIIIADDGSNADTVDRIKQYIADHPQMHILHLWHPDEGWRKNIILNKAVAAAKGEYLCFLDADCIPAPRWAEDHLRLARPHTVIAGRRSTFAPWMNEKWEATTSLSPDWFKHLRRDFMRNYFRFPSHTHPSRIIRLSIVRGKGLLQRTTGKLIGCNFCLWRRDLLDINGFDERYLGPGLGEDIDIAWRIRFNGCSIEKVPHQAITIHRNHPSSMTSVSSPTYNPGILDQTKAERLTYTPYGINKPASDSSQKAEKQKS